VRRRAKFLVISAILAVGVAWPLLTPVMPKGLTPDEATFARHALRLGRQGLEDPVTRGLAWRYVVRDIERLSDRGTCGDVPFVAQGQYRATVIAVGPFGVQIARAAVDCDSASRIP